MSFLSIPLSKSSDIVSSKLSKLLLSSPDFTKDTSTSKPASINEFLISGSIIDPRLSSEIMKILFLFTKGEIILGISLAKFSPIWISYEFLSKLIVMVFVFVII